MDLRCSLFGHDFVDEDIEREHERRGREEITTLRQYQACRHCGKRRLVSEKRHVRAAESGVDEADDASYRPEEARGNDSSDIGDGRADEGERDLTHDEGVEVYHRDERRESSEGEYHQARFGSATDPRRGGDIIEAPTDPTPKREAGKPTSTQLAEGVTVDRTDRRVACPSCGLTPDGESSLRAGDSCPSCKTAYLELGER